MSDPIDISIITASYNLLKSGRKEKIIRCLESIHAQKNVKYEHLIIDGASTDGTLEFLSPYEKKDWIKIYSEPDKGIYDAFNKGIDKALGKYVCFINSDDYLNTPEGLSVSLNLLQQTGADFSYSPVSYEQGGHIISTDEKRTDMRNVFYHIPGCHQGMLFKKSLFGQIGLHELKFEICADYDFILRAVLSKATSVRVPQSYAVFSMEGLSGSNPEQLAQESIAIKAKNYNCSYKEAEKIHQTLYVPWKLYIKLLSCTAVDNKFSYLLWNWRHSPQRQKLKALRHWIFTLRTRKGRRALRILGINIVSEEKR